MYPLGFNVSINFVTLYLSLKPWHQHPWNISFYVLKSLQQRGMINTTDLDHVILCYVLKALLRALCIQKQYNRLEIDSLSTSSIVCKKATSVEKTTTRTLSADKLMNIHRICVCLDLAWTIVLFAWQNLLFIKQFAFTVNHCWKQPVRTVKFN